MRTPDPIADNQTEQTIIALTNGSADDSVRDHATAALLSSVQKLIAKMGTVESKTDEIERNLWKPSDLEKTIDSRHRLLCQACPVRKYVEDVQREKNQPQPQQEEQQTKKSFLLALVTNPTAMLTAVLAVISILMGVALMYATIGPQGFRDVTDAVHLTAEEAK